MRAPSPGRVQGQILLDDRPGRVSPRGRSGPGAPGRPGRACRAAPMDGPHRPGRRQPGRRQAGRPGQLPARGRKPGRLTCSVISSGKVAPHGPTRAQPERRRAVRRPAMPRRMQPRDAGVSGGERCRGHAVAAEADQPDVVGLRAAVSQRPAGQQVVTSGQQVVGSAQQVARSAHQVIKSAQQVVEFGQRPVRLLGPALRRRRSAVSAAPAGGPPARTAAMACGAVPIARSRPMSTAAGSWSERNGGSHSTDRPPPGRAARSGRNSAASRPGGGSGGRSRRSSSAGAARSCPQRPGGDLDGGPAGP